MAARTVGRDDILEAVLRRLRAAATSGNRPHTLLVGPRGSGKTHVIEVALHHLAADPACQERLLVARIDEDAVGIASYADLLAALIGTSPTGRRPAADLEADLLASLDGRVLVVVIENLARVFESMRTSGQRALRSLVENSGQIVLLASTPLLFRAVGSRDEPWFGSFSIDHLSELSLAEGTELLCRLASDDHDDRFVEFLESPKGQARLAALHNLAGGSHRLWMVLAAGATVELLDELVPAVEQLLENLVTYFQQRLWELPANEARLVRALGTGPPSATVRDLAAACGLDERTAATALGRLSDAGWVRREKLPGADRRRTWYRLREPLLRHHFQYRSTGIEPLRLIVEILRAWYDAYERSGHLAAAAAQSESERYLLATMALDPPGTLRGFFGRWDGNELVAEARRWIADEHQLATPDAGVLLEAVLLAALQSRDIALSTLETRQAPGTIRACAEAVIERIDYEGSAHDRLETAIRLLSTVNGEPVFELVAACWDGERNPAATASRLGALAPASPVSRLGLAIRHAYGYWLHRGGRQREALAVLGSVIDDYDRTFGSDDREALAALETQALVLDSAERHEDARINLTRLRNARLRVLGPLDRDTLRAGQALALQARRLGLYDQTAKMLTALVRDYERSIGSTDPDAVHAKGMLAVALAAAGDVDRALSTLDGLALDTRSVPAAAESVDFYRAWSLSMFGRHEEAIAASNNIAGSLASISPRDSITALQARLVPITFMWWGGRAPDALILLESVVDDCTQELGATHPETLDLRVIQVRLMSSVGRHREAAIIAANALDDAASAGNEKLENTLRGGLWSAGIRLLHAREPVPGLDRPPESPARRTLDLLATAEAAVDGSAAALARLPTELRPLVDELRKHPPDVVARPS
ncbi:MAG: AAA family ATPase [Chloroflexota bacterium]